MSAEVAAGGRAVPVSRPDKPMFPDAGLAKRDLVGYYADVAPAMLAHVRGRPVAMHRFPDGVAGEGFFHKDAPEHFPEWVPRVEVPLARGGVISQVVCEDAATLAYLAEQGTVTPHVWLSRAGRLDRPDRLIVDLDPPPGEGFPAVRRVARDVRALLDEVGLAGFVMTTGSKGLHVTVPLEAAEPFDDVRAFAHDLASALARREPRRCTTEQRRARREGRVYLDVQRNAYGQTAVPPYAVRALPEAPVATPLEWDELGASGMGPRRHTVASIPRRLARRSDPWADIDAHARPLDGPRRRLREAG